MHRYGLSPPNFGRISSSSISMLPKTPLFSVSCLIVSFLGKLRSLPTIVSPKRRRKLDSRSCRSWPTTGAFISGKLPLISMQLRQIQKGSRDWGDDTRDLEFPTLMHKLRPTQSASKVEGRGQMKKSRSDRDGRWGRGGLVLQNVPYQRNKCKQQAPHSQTTAGQSRQVQHVCATCWQKEKAKIYHSESSSAFTHDS